MPFIFGTLYSSFIALVLAVPVSVGAAIFLSELAPRWIRTPATFLIELLAAIPSVIYGLWGIFILIPFLKVFIFKPVLGSRLPHLPVVGQLFGGQSAGYSMLAAGMILAIMVTPFITAVTRDILRAIPAFPARRLLCAGRDAVGNHRAGRHSLRQVRHYRRGHSGPGPGAWARRWR